MVEIKKCNVRLYYSIIIVWKTVGCIKKEKASIKIKQLNGSNLIYLLYEYEKNPVAILHFKNTRKKTA